jgi:hypothetical protein
LPGKRDDGAAILSGRQSTLRKGQTPAGVAPSPSRFSAAGRMPYRPNAHRTSRLSTRRLPSAKTENIIPGNQTAVFGVPALKGAC